MNLKQKIFLLKSSHNTRLSGKWNDKVDLEQVTCSSVASHMRPGRRLGALSIELPLKAFNQPIAWTWYSECLVNKTTVELFHNSELTGFELQPLEITHRGIPIDHEFYELIVTGWGGMACDGSGVRRIRECSACGYLRYSDVTDWQRLIDWDRWDGSDIFMVWPLPKFIFITEKTALIIKQLSCKSAEVISIDDLETQNGTLAPGRLSYYFPLSRIRELNISSDIT
jgi:hypothetical protein